MRDKKVLDKSRIRRIRGSFSWLDHRFVNDGHIKYLSSTEILLYLFLVAVGDRYGLSYYGDKTICNLLKLDIILLNQARDALIKSSLIKYEEGICQVLELPENLPDNKGSSLGEDISSTGDVLKEVLRRVDEKRRYLKKMERESRY